MYTYITTYFLCCWDICVDSAPYMLVGFSFAGLPHIFINPQAIAAHFGEGRIKPVIYAALVGIPLPLFSCSVLPAVTGLKKRGANDGAAMSFLIATPETGWIQFSSLTHFLTRS
jgi:uncharacterized membrane protein YraQ (UPF0718 family)